MFWDNLQEACRQNNIKVTPLLQELKLSTGNIGRWKNGGSVTSDALLVLSARLGVTTDYLLTGVHPKPQNALSGISDEEAMIIKMYRGLSEKDQGKCYGFMKCLYDESAAAEEKTAG